jgi:hypothetical protein
MRRTIGARLHDGAVRRSSNRGSRAGNPGAHRIQTTIFSGKSAGAFNMSLVSRSSFLVDLVLVEFQPAY